MQYDASLPFNGNTGKAFALAETALISIGFRLTERTATRLELVGPGMNSTKESVLTGASSISILSDHGTLTIKAELGGVERMSRFVRLFPPGLCLVLAVLLLPVFYLQSGPGAAVFTVAVVAGGNALLWVLIGPWFAGRLKARACRGLDGLLASMVTAGASR